MTWPPKVRLRGTNFWGYCNGKIQYRIQTEDCKGIPCRTRRIQSLIQTARDYEISNRTLCKSQAFGEDGLRRSRAQQTYTFEFKCSAVECYLSTEASYQEIAIALGLNNPTLLVRWTKEYRSGGVDALRPKPKGRAPTMPKQRKARLQDPPQDETAQQLKALQDENLRLRIEIAYLKELRRQRLQEKMQSKRQGSSTASEENFSWKTSLPSQGFPNRPICTGKRNLLNRKCRISGNGLSLPFVKNTKIMAIAAYGRRCEILGTGSIARRCSGLCRSLDFKCIPLRTERASTALTGGRSARLQTISWTADSKPLSRTRRSQQIQVSSNTGRKATMGSPSPISCISIRIWISLIRRLSVFTSDRHRLPRGFRAHWTKQFVWHRIVLIGAPSTLIRGGHIRWSRTRNVWRRRESFRACHAKGTVWTTVWWKTSLDS